MRLRQVIRRACTLLAAAAAAVPLATGTALGDGGGGANNVVSVVNSAGTLLRGHAQVAFFGGDNSQSSNIASALSQNCTGCHTRAVAVQELVLTGDPSQFAPSNAASAVNSGCEGCDTVAYAYQDVIQSSRGAYLTPQVQAQVQDLESQIAAAASDLSISDTPYTAADGSVHSPLTDKLESLAGQLDAVVRDGLVSDGSGVYRTATYRQAPTQ